MLGRRRLLALLPLCVGVIAALAIAARFRGAEDPCPSARSAVVVQAGSHTLWLCQGGRARGRFRVSLGSEGMDKRVRGDRRTPVGTYTLGAPRPSERWGTFIPIGYPSAEQQGLGYTGSAVGIHGPERRLRWAGAANAWVDWTAGCIAVPSDEALARVAEAASGKGPTITIR